jgi:hypothetical protein
MGVYRLAISPAAECAGGQVHSKPIRHSGKSNPMPRFYKKAALVAISRSHLLIQAGSPVRKPP